MIRIEHRKGYDVIICLSDNGQQQAKVYIKENGLISNLYVRKAYRANKGVFKAIADTLLSQYNHLPLYGYASPKGNKARRAALIRLYRRYGFINPSTNKVVYDPKGEYGW